MRKFVEPNSVSLLLCPFVPLAPFLTEVFLPHVSTPDGFTSRHLRKEKQKTGSEKQNRESSICEPIEAERFLCCCLNDVQ